MKLKLKTITLTALLLIGNPKTNAKSPFLAENPFLTAQEVQKVLYEAGVCSCTLNRFNTIQELTVEKCAQAIADRYYPRKDLEDYLPNTMEIMRRKHGGGATFKITELTLGQDGEKTPTTIEKIEAKNCPF